MPRSIAAVAFMLASLTASAAMATPVTVAATADLYGAAGTLPAGTAPVLIALPGGATSITFSASGSITLNGGGNFNDPDGIGSAQGITVLSANNISGISAPHAGFLGGVFLTDVDPGSPAPTSLDYNTLGTGNASYTPAIAQAFFIGDGLTGDGGGTTQVFYIPTGATRLFLGYADACSYNGTPSCYNDNSGTLSVSYAVTGVPEPASIAMLGIALIGVGVIRRKR